MVLSKNLIIKYFSILLCWSFAFSQNASAQSSNNAYQTEKDGAALEVREREKPDFDPIGVRAGSFLLYPSVTGGIEYDDNIFALSTGEVSDVIYLIDPRLIIKSQWARHKLDFDFSLNHKEYRDNDAESHTNYQGQVDGRLDVTRDFKIDGSFYAGRLHEARGSADAPTTASEPTPYTQIETKVSLNKTFNRLSTSFGFAYLDFDYEDVNATGGGTIDQDNRDGNIITVINRTAYEFSPGYKAFVFSEYNTRDFVGTVGSNRDSEGYRVLGGIEFEVSRILKGEVGLGYLNQDYSAAAFQDISGFSYSASAVWQPTPLMTFKASGDRTVAETVVTGASGRLDTTGGLTLDYEVLRNLIISPSFNYQLNEFEGITREDTLITTGVTLDYLLNRHIHFGMSYSHIDRDSNLTGLDYERQKVGANVKAQF